MVASAIGRAGHFAVAGIKIATMAQGETVSFVGAQEIGWRGFDQWNVRALRPAAVHQSTINALQIHDARMLAQVVGRVDPLKPLPFIFNQSNLIKYH